MSIKIKNNSDKEFHFEGLHMKPMQVVEVSNEMAGRYLVLYGNNPLVEVTSNGTVNDPPAPKTPGEDATKKDDSFRSEGEGAGQTPGGTDQESIETGKGETGGEKDGEEVETSGTEKE